MRASSRVLGALETRVGLRTFVLFGACALVPIALFAVWSYRIVSSELTEAATARLGESGKRYGLLINERLLIVEALLVDVAQRQLWEGASHEAYVSPFGSRLRLVRLSTRSDTAARPESAERYPAEPRVLEAPEILSRHLQIAGRSPKTAVQLTVEVRGNGRVATAVGELDPEYLWNPDASEIAEAISCVQTSGGISLHCTLPDRPRTLDGGERPDRQLHAEWRLFLKPRYGVEEWIISTSQPEGVALHSLHAFQATLPYVAGLALSVALLLSLVQIRRSHGPLRVLIAATQRMGRGRFGARIRLSGRDEYAGLAQAFNRLSGRLKRQFRLRAAFSEVDRSILRHPAMEPILGAMLPRVLEVLECDVVAALILRSEGEGSHLTSVRRDGQRRCETERTRLGEPDLEALAVSLNVDFAAVGRSALFRESALGGSNCASWHVAPVRVGRQLRGVLLLGFCAPRRVRKSTPRHALELARRLAVALSNEDRDRALIKQAYGDALTGLANRQLFRDRLARELVHSKRLGAGGAVLFIDLDRFKNVNDSLGHSAGDHLLKVAAERLQCLIGECDTLARIGGDEFTLICPELDANAAGALAGRILKTLSLPEELAGMRCVMQASIGIACFPRDGVSVEAVIRNADTAMYRAKSSGGAKAVFFEEAMNAAAVRRLSIEQRLREALDDNRLTLHFQPKVNASDHTLAGAEALARWDDAEEGTQSPAEFIQVAEECGLIAQLGTWALDSACGTLKQWRDRGLPIGHIAVNVSVHQLRDADFPGIVRRCLERHGLPRGCLELEITESTLMHDVAEVTDVLKQVRALGVLVAIDDFGTGYSSLAVLQRLPVDILKIDRAFVSAGPDDPEGAALFDTLVRIGHALGKRAVAEGIETAEQAGFAHAHGCDLLQGYLFGAAVPAEEFVRTWFAGPTASAIDDTARGRVKFARTGK